MHEQAINSLYQVELYHDFLLPFNKYRIS